MQNGIPETAYDRGYKDGNDNARICTDDSEYLRGYEHGRQLREAREARTKYSVIRFYREARIRRRVILSGLSLAEAQAHCNDPETSSRTCTKASGVARTRMVGIWFDGYEKE